MRREDQMYDELRYIDDDDCPLARCCSFTSLELRPQQVLYAIGDPADQVYYLRDGIIGVFRNHRGRVESLRLPGSFLGLDCLTGQRRVVAARALSRALLCAVTKTAFLEWLMADEHNLELVLDEALRDPDIIEQIDTRL